MHKSVSSNSLQVQNHLESIDTIDIQYDKYDFELSNNIEVKVEVIIGHIKVTTTFNLD